MFKSLCTSSAATIQLSPSDFLKREVFVLLDRNARRGGRSFLETQSKLTVWRILNFAVGVYSLLCPFKPRAMTSL